MNTITIIKIALLLIINIYQIKKIKLIDNDILFSILSLDLLALSSSYLYYYYKMYAISLLFTFINIFILFSYIKCTKEKKHKYLISLLFIVNTYIFIYGTLVNFF